MFADEFIRIKKKTTEKGKGRKKERRERERPPDRYLRADSGEIEAWTEFRHGNKKRGKAEQEGGRQAATVKTPVGQRTEAAVTTNGQKGGKEAGAASHHTSAFYHRSEQRFEKRYTRM